jgi:hypothetical protein
MLQSGKLPKSVGFAGPGGLEMEAEEEEEDDEDENGQVCWKLVE